MGYTEDLNEKLIGWKTCFANLKSSLNFISTANHITCYHTGAISFIFFWKYLLPPPSYGKLVDSTLLQVLWQPWVPPCSIFNNHAMTSYIPHIKKNKWWVCHAGVISRVDASLPRLRHCRDGKKKNLDLLVKVSNYCWTWRLTYKEVIASRLNIAGVLETTYGIIHTSALSDINGVLHL